MLILFHLLCEILLNNPLFSISKLTNWNILGYILIVVLCIPIAVDMLTKISLIIRKLY